MTKLINLTISILITLTIAACSNTGQQSSESIQTEQSQIETVKNETTNNVGDNQSYLYEVTSVSNDEINGVPLNKVSSDNAGIFLYQSELDFKVKQGDTISVVWGQYEDEFKSIEKVEVN